jgi:acetoin utilization protein AcuB
MGRAARLAQWRYFLLEGHCSIMKTETPVTRLMVSNPVTVDVNQELGDVKRVFSGQRFHHLPVLRNGRLAGMISTSDLLKLDLGEPDAAGSSPAGRHLRIEDIMNKDVIRISDRATVAEAARILSGGGFHALPVVDHDGRLQGLLTSTDLITFLLEEPVEPLVSTVASRRLKLLETVLKAAELYLRSGLAESEHARLHVAIEAAKNTSEGALLDRP